jgi:hypothetical protein
MIPKSIDQAPQDGSYILGIYHPAGEAFPIYEVIKYQTSKEAVKEYGGLEELYNNAFVDEYGMESSATHFLPYIPLREDEKIQQRS